MVTSQPFLSPGGETEKKRISKKMNKNISDVDKFGTKYMDDGAGKPKGDT